MVLWREQSVTLTHFDLRGGHQLSWKWTKEWVWLLHSRVTVAAVGSNPATISTLPVSNGRGAPPPTSGPDQSLKTSPGPTRRSCSSSKHFWFRFCKRVNRKFLLWVYLGESCLQTTLAILPSISFRPRSYLYIYSQEHILASISLAATFDSNNWSLKKENVLAS